MSQSLARNWIHLIFSTKKRTPWLKADARKALFAYMAGILKKWESPAVAIGGTEDHVHILFALSKNYALKKVVEEVKRGSSKWLKTRGPDYRGFHWQNGYGAFSVSQSNLDKVKTYVANQEEHHRRRTFQDESRDFLRKHGIEVNEEFLWD